MLRIIALLALLTVPALAESTTQPAMTDQQKFSYTIGMNIGQSFGAQGLEIDLQAVINGLTDAVKKNEAKMTPAQMQEAMMKLQQTMQAKQAGDSTQNLAEGKAFAQENAKKKGVTTTKSGLQYNVITKGTGTVHPKATDKVTVHYNGTLIDGTVFDSSYKRGEPATFPLNGVIKGWTEGVQLMVTGDKYLFVIPADLAYGPQGRPGIPANATLVFEVELISIDD